MGVPRPSAMNFGFRDNREQSLNLSVHSDESDPDGHQPELSDAAAKGITRLSTKKTGSSLGKSRQRLRNSPADVDKPEPEKNRSSATKVVRDLDSGFIPSPSKQCSAPPSNLGIRALRSGRQIGMESDLRKVFQLSTQTAVNSSGKRDLAAMAEADELNGPADAAKPLRKVACSVPMSGGRIESEPDRLHGEVNPSRQPPATPGPPNNPFLLAPDLRHDLAPAACEQLHLRTSAEHLLMLASEAQPPADISAT